MQVGYFEEAQNRLVEARVRELHRTRLLVENRQDQKLWSIPFCAVNADGVKTGIRGVAAEPYLLDRSRLKIGDAVGFRDRKNQDRYGHVVAVNQKTVTLSAGDNPRWRIAYQFLFPVIDSNKE